MKVGVSGKLVFPRSEVHNGDAVFIYAMHVPDWFCSAFQFVFVWLKGGYGPQLSKRYDSLYLGGSTMPCCERKIVDRRVVGDVVFKCGINDGGSPVCCVELAVDKRSSGHSHESLIDTFC